MDNKFFKYVIKICDHVYTKDFDKNAQHFISFYFLYKNSDQDWSS